MWCYVVRGLSGFCLGGGYCDDRDRVEFRWSQACFGFLCCLCWYPHLGITCREECTCLASRLYRQTMSEYVGIGEFFRLVKLVCWCLAVCLDLFGRECEGVVFGEECLCV